MTPLHEAAFNGHQSLFRKLIHGHEPSLIKDVLGFTAADYLSISECEGEVHSEKDRESPLTVPAPAPPPEPVEEPVPVAVATPAVESKPVPKGKKK
jgi:hypothetical protein